MAHTHDLVCLTGAREGLPARFLARRRVAELDRRIRELKGAFPDRLYVQLFHDRLPWDDRRARVLRRFAQDVGLPIVAAPEVRHALAARPSPAGRAACARLGIDVDTPHPQRPQNEGGAMVAPAVVAERLPFPESAANADWVAERAAFDLLPERLVPPKARVPNGLTAGAHLERRCYEALIQRYTGEPLAQARVKLEAELATIRALGLDDFFLVAAEVTDYCRAHGILAAGRGSAAASICCYLLGITQADPIAHDLLFERFLHTGKDAMPDVDIDISSARRDQVLAWVEERFGATTEAMVANKITYRLPSALQDLGRALGIPSEQRAALTRALGRDYRHLSPARAREAAVVFDEVLGDAPVKEHLLDLLDAHGAAPHPPPRPPLRRRRPGARPAHPLLPVGALERRHQAAPARQGRRRGPRPDQARPARAPDARRARARTRRGLPHRGALARPGRPPDDPRVWDLVAEGATMGLFQIESPSQVNTAKVMRSRTMKDLAHQIALIRPGPIQSGTVHPYLKRRRGLEPITYWHPSLEPILAKSYGVLLFQEDVLRIAVHFAGMTWIEADRFRKKVSGFRDLADIEPDRLRFVEGARATVGATQDEAMRVFDAIKAYQGYGFAESHAWAFALHAYASAWMRLHHPAAYLAAILTEEPGMWSPAPSGKKRARGACPFLPLDVNRSGVHYRVERAADGRLGRPPALTAVKHVATDFARELLVDRLRHGPYRDVDDAVRRVDATRDGWEALVRAGAFDALGPRRPALYRTGVAVRSQETIDATPMFDASTSTPELRALAAGGALRWDHHTTRISTLELHALDLIRDQLTELAAITLWQVRRRPGRAAAAPPASSSVANVRGRPRASPSS